jgi:hypothetical protein
MDITPSWKAILPILIDMYGKPRTRDYAIGELQRMAEAADEHNATQDSIVLNAIDQPVASA